jgi:hypothetical protein
MNIDISKGIDIVMNGRNCNFFSKFTFFFNFFWKNAIFLDNFLKKRLGFLKNAFRNSRISVFGNLILSVNRCIFTCQKTQHFLHFEKGRDRQRQRDREEREEREGERFREKERREGRETERDRDRERERI